MPIELPKTLKESREAKLNETLDKIDGIVVASFQENKNKNNIIFYTDKLSNLLALEIDKEIIEAMKDKYSEGNIIMGEPFIDGENNRECLQFTLSKETI